MKVIDGETMVLSLKNLVLDKAVQMRACISTQAVQDYADSMKEGDKFPPVIVYGMVGAKWYVADGTHRVLAARKAGLKEIMAEVHHGGKREAMLFAMRANSAHGVRRTNADKQRAVESCLKDKEWVKWTDSEIARRCAVSAQLVARLREVAGSAGVRVLRTYVTSTGEIRTRTVPYRQPTEGPAANDARYCRLCGQQIPGK